MDALFKSLLGFLDLRGGDETDIAKIDAGLAHLRQAVASCVPDDPMRPFHLWSLGVGMMRRGEVSGHSADFSEAALVLAEAQTLVGGPSHQHWAEISETLAAVRRRLGHSAEARHAALLGLRRYAWHAMEQSTAFDVASAAATAAESAVENARWCITECAVADAVQSLDAGRALILFAATAIRDVAGRLDTLDRPDLAERWRLATADGGQPSTELRRTALTALAGGEDAAWLDPPTVPKIREALRCVEAEALVYLIPAKPPVPGYAVIVSVDAATAALPLTQLVVEDDDVERYLAAAGVRELSAPDSQEALAGRIDALCDWMWRAAIRALCERYLGSRSAPPDGRLPHLVLVPMGNLARLPWAAARDDNGRYAVDRIAFSQAASARMLCDTATRPPVPIGPTGLVVGDPRTGTSGADLPSARAEAYAIREAFYPGARYVGRFIDGAVSGSGAGTVDDVRRWLSDLRPGAGAMLHLACHGTIQEDNAERSSFLYLAERGILRHPRRAANQQYPLDLAPAQAGGLDCGLGQVAGGVQQVCRRVLELLSGDLDRPHDAGGSQHYLRLGHHGEAVFGDLCPLPQHRDGLDVVEEIRAVLSHEGLVDHPHHDVVEVEPAQVAVALDGQHAQLVLACLHHGDVKRAAAEVVYEKPAARHPVRAVAERGGGGLVQDTYQVESGDRARVGGRLAACRVEVGRYGDHRLPDWLAEKCLGVLLEALEDEGRYFFGSILIAVARDVAVVRVAHVPLDELDDVERRQCRRALGHGADQRYAVL